MIHWHNKLRDFLAGWLEALTGMPTLTEQPVPKWDKHLPPSAEFPEGRVKMAQLDVSGFILGQRTHLDVGFTNAATDNDEERIMRAQQDGRAARHYVDGKRSRYPAGDNPGEPMVPFIIEALGRPSLEAIAFLRSVAPSAPAQRAVVLASAWQTISIITQTRLAELYISAERSRPPR